MKKTIKKLNVKAIGNPKEVKGGTIDKPSNGVFPRSWSVILD